MTKVLGAALALALGFSGAAHAADCPDLSGHYAIRDVGKACGAYDAQAEYFHFGRPDRSFITIGAPTDLVVTQSGCERITLTWTATYEDGVDRGTLDIDMNTGFTSNQDSTGLVQWRKNGIEHPEKDHSVSGSLLPGAYFETMPWSVTLDKKGNLLMKSRDFGFGMFFYLFPIGHSRFSKCRFERI